MYKKNNILKIGGIVTNIKFLDNGTHILIYNTNQKKFIQIKFDDVLLFQKLTFEEEIKFSIGWKSNMRMFIGKDIANKFKNKMNDGCIAITYN